jgi:hypothetical protein
LQDSPERGKELKFKGLGSARERLWCGCGCEEEDVVIARGVEDQRTRGEEENEVAIDGDDWMERGRMAEEEEAVEQWILWQRCKIYYCLKWDLLACSYLVDGYYLCREHHVYHNGGYIDFLASDASGQQGSDSCQDTWVWLKLVSPALVIL